MRDRQLRTLDRVLSRSGVGSRTQAAEWIRARRVRVGSRVVTNPDAWIDPTSDDIRLDGKPIETAPPIHLMLHKPKGVLTSRAADVKGRRTVYDLLPETESFVFPVGRLDLDTSGILLMTNDSDFAETLTDPAFHVPKTYLVKATTRLSDEQLDALRAGVTLSDGPTRPATITRLRDPGGRTVFEITITEGRNRQVRRMVSAVGSKVLSLARIAVGPLRIGELQPGESRTLTPAELRGLLRAGRRPPCR